MSTYRKQSLEAQVTQSKEQGVTCLPAELPDSLDTVSKTCPTAQAFPAHQLSYTCIM